MDRYSDRPRSSRTCSRRAGFQTSTATVEVKVPSLSNNQDTSWVRNLCRCTARCTSHLRVVENDTKMREHSPLVPESSDQFRSSEHHPACQRHQSGSLILPHTVGRSVYLNMFLYFWEENVDDVHGACRWCKFEIIFHGREHSERWNPQAWEHCSTYTKDNLRFEFVQGQP